MLHKSWCCWEHIGNLGKMLREEINLTMWWERIENLMRATTKIQHHPNAPKNLKKNLPMVSAFIIRLGSFDAAQGLLSAYSFLYRESEGEEILSTICFCWEELCVFIFWDRAYWKQVVVRDIPVVSTPNYPPCHIRTRYRPAIETLWCFF